MVTEQSGTPTTNQKSNMALGLVLVVMIVILTWTGFAMFCKYDREHTLRMYSGRQTAVMSLTWLAYNTIEKMGGSLALRTIEGVIKKASRDPEIFHRVKKEHEVPIDDRLMVGYGNMVISMDGKPALVGGPLGEYFSPDDNGFTAVSPEWAAPFDTLAGRLRQSGSRGEVLTEFFTLVTGEYMVTGMILPGMPRETVVFLYAGTRDVLKVYGYFQRKRVVLLFSVLFTAMALVGGVLLVRGLKHEVRTNLELERKADELRAEIKNRIAAEQQREALQDQLTQSQKMEALGVLAGSVAHDFNNMLTVILGHSELGLLSSDSDPATLNSFAKISEATKKARGLTRKLLSMSRKEKLNVAPLSVNTSIMEVLSVLERSCDRKISFSQSLAPDTPPVAADASQLEQAFLNIGMNACEAMQDGGVLRVETCAAKPGADIIETHPECGAGEYCRVCFSDTGPGISRDIAARVFDPFFTTKKRGQGTGLGLSITHRIIKNHGGFVLLESNAGEGARFEIYLPACEKDVTASDSFENREDRRRGSETILVIEDEPEVLEVALEVLDASDYKTLSASGGREALSVFHENKDKIDLVLLDWNMPDMNGTEVYRELSRLDPDVKVILVSGYSESGRAGELLGTGVKLFLQKPYDIDELNSAVKKALEL